jgi:hypothetical protein
MNELKKITKQLALEIAKVREAFIVEELKPYYEYKDGQIIFTQKVNLRLAQIKDYKEILIEKIKKYYEENPKTAFEIGSNIAINRILKIIGDE